MNVTAAGIRAVPAPVAATCRHETKGEYMKTWNNVEDSRDIHTGPQAEITRHYANHQVKAPNGSKIIGTLETIPGTALITDAKIDGDVIAFEYEGETKVDWNSQSTVTWGEQRVFVAEDGSLWREEELIRFHATHEQLGAVSTKHSRLPWQLSIDWERVLDDTESFVADCKSRSSIVPTNTENARFIVRAVNSHAELVEALSELLEAVGHIDGFEDLLGKVEDKARTVLSKDGVQS